MTFVAAFIGVCVVGMLIKQQAIANRRRKAGKAMYLAGLKPLSDEWIPRNVVNKEYGIR